MNIPNSEEFEFLDRVRIGFELEFYSRVKYIKLLEVLNRNLDSLNIQVEGVNKYHSKVQTRPDLFKLEPDLSGGDDMVELITHYYPYFQARLILVKLLQILKNYAYTNERTAFQFTLSLDSEDPAHSLTKLNWVEFVLLLDEERIYSDFPDRFNNVYCRSVKNLMVAGQDYDYTPNPDLIGNNSLAIPQDKFYGVNFSKLGNGLVEFRYMGGKDYPQKVEIILDTIHYLTMLLYRCLDVPISTESRMRLNNILNDNWLFQRKLNNYASFKTHFPHIQLLIEGTYNQAVIESRYGEWLPRLRTLFRSLVDHNLGAIRNEEEVILNYLTTERRWEVKNAVVRLKSELSFCDFIECNLEGGSIKDGFLVDCHGYRLRLDNCDVRAGKIKDSVLYKTDVDAEGKLVNCFFRRGMMAGTMIGGVFRSGRTDSDTKFKNTRLVNRKYNFFTVGSRIIRGTKN